MSDYDVIIVGARVAGAATAMGLARAGHRVLVLDRARRGADTVSTHALMRPAVQQLERWGLLEDVIGSGAPGQDRVIFHYGDRSVPVPVTSRLYAPRRPVLDGLLVRAAEASGAEFRFGSDVCGLLRGDDGRVRGVQLRSRGRHGSGGSTSRHTARITVGADGRRSLVARLVDAPVTRRGAAATGTVYGYWTGVPTAGYEWFFRPGVTAGLIPTNDGKVCVFTGTPRDRFDREVRRDLSGGFWRVLRESSPDLADRVRAGAPSERLRGFPGPVAWLRRPWGDGWALVGDAGYYKDPTTAHGLTDAMRDAELLARAIDRAMTGAAPPMTALRDYERARDHLSDRMFTVTDALASFAWDLDEAQALHLAMSAAMRLESEAMAALDPAPLAAAASHRVAPVSGRSPRHRERTCR